MSFKNYGLEKSLLKAATLLGFNKPTPVQERVIPEVLRKQDLIVQSQTGSGKTAAFAIPICQEVIWEENKPQALVLTPTRELAIQVKEDFFQIGRFKRIKSVGLYGKAPFQVQQKELSQKTHVVVGTPGRVLDHLERGTLEASHISYLVIDEADEMLRMGFIDQVESIIAALPLNRVTLLFSATMAPHIQQLCEKYLRTPKTIHITTDLSKPNNIEEIGIETHEQTKLAVLEAVTIVENPESCIIFCNRKERVEMVWKRLNDLNYGVGKIHGDMEQKQRFAVMEDFRKGRFRYLVATDVAARGIDIDHITHVINFDVPEQAENYVHRMGRIGRAGRSGKAFIFIQPEDKRNLASIESYTTRKIPMRTAYREEEIASAKKAFEEKMKQPLQFKETKGEVLNQEIMKLHINAGKKTKMRPVDIVGTLCHLPGITAEDIGIINLQDISTYVEILNGKGEKVFKLLQTTPIKGRMRRVSKVD